MTTRWVGQVAAVVALLGLLAFAATRILEGLLSPRTQPAAGLAPVAAPETAHIAATLFFGSSDGQALATVRREVQLAADPVAQGRQILIAQLQSAPPPYVSVIPAGTTLRAFYLTGNGDAFVDLSPQVSSAHPGGSFNEMLTVHAIVNVVAVNLPTVRRVQVLVGGKEVDTLAGHVDLRRPLEPDRSLVREQ
jgi:spore germination protein GerM